MKFFAHIDKVEPLTLYQMDSSLCPNLFMQLEMETPKSKRTAYFARNLLMVLMRSIT
jgi:hypothetical protein